MAKCAKCGYVGVRNPRTRLLVGPDENQLETGTPTEWPISNNTHYVWAVSCAVGACNLLREWYERTQHGQNKIEATNEVLQTDRTCAQFTSRLPGLTPKEHIDMNMLAQQQSWQDARDRREERRDARFSRQSIYGVVHGCCCYRRCGVCLLCWMVRNTAIRALRDRRPTTAERRRYCAATAGRTLGSLCGCTHTAPFLEPRISIFVWGRRQRQAGCR